MFRQGHVVRMSLARSGNSKGRAAAGGVSGEEGCGEASRSPASQGLQRGVGSEDRAMRSRRRVWSRGECDQTHVSIYTRDTVPTLLSSLCLNSPGGLEEVIFPLQFVCEVGTTAPTSQLLGAAWWQKRKVLAQGRDAQIGMETGMC